MKMDILVMENLFYDTSVKKVFDLKGSMRNRYAEKTGKDVEVFLDENLVEGKHNSTCLFNFFLFNEMNFYRFSHQQESTLYASRYKMQSIRFALQ